MRPARIAHRGFVARALAMLVACGCGVWLRPGLAEEPAATDRPTDILLDASVIRPGRPGPFGIFTVTDARVGATHQLTLASGEGDTDNAKFAIATLALVPWLFDFATLPPGSVLSLRVRATDVGKPDRWLEKAFTLTLAAPQAPTALRLDARSVSSRAEPGWRVAAWAVEDPDPDDRHRVEPVPGLGDFDNGAIEVDGGGVRLTRPLAAGQGRLRFRLRATDGAGLFREEAFDLPVSEPRVRLNEILAGELGGIPDQNRGRKEWIELWNERPQYENLSGWYLTDDRSVPNRWRMPGPNLMPEGFGVVLADGLGTAPAGSTHFHAGFSLRAEGEWVGLVLPDGRTVVSELEFPAQYPGVSYGFGSEGRLGHLPRPTPQAANGAVAAYGMNEVRFSRARGFSQQAFQLELSATVPGSVIRYTLDGSVPTATAGQAYQGAVQIVPSTTAATRGIRVVRALAIHPEAAYAPVATHTYVFVNGVTAPETDGVVGQSRLSAAITRHAVYGPLLDDALLALPTLSLNLPGSPGTTERAGSLELIDPAGLEPGFQSDCGVHATGTTSLGSPKLSLAAKFRFQYGRARLEYPMFARGSRFPDGAATAFKELRLRSHSHDTFYWLGTRENPPVPYGNPPVTRSGDAQLARNPWIDEMQLAMGQPGKRGRQVHLYLNGAYHGIYHVHEHADEDFMASYFPGGSGDFHFVGGGTTGSDHGSGDTWRVPWTALKASLANYAQAQRWIDVTNLCDSMILSFYAGNDWDWSAQHNWSAAGPRLPDRGGWKFFQQDSDICLQDVAADCTDQDVPDGIFNALMRHAGFRVLFRDRVYRHCFGGGWLTPARAAAFYEGWVNEIATAIVAETARWQPSSSVASLPWDRDQEWANERRYLRETFFPQRTDRLLQQFRRRSGWWPIEPPVPSLASGSVPAGSVLVFSAPAGTIYYTVDGSDPRLAGGGMAPGARRATSGGIVVDQPLRLRARVFAASDWSAAVDLAVQPADIPVASAASLLLTEIQYHPLGEPDSEFLEFLNATGAAIDLSGVVITQAVQFHVPPATFLGAGERVVLVKDPGAFARRYGAADAPYRRSGLRVLGPWVGSLANSGERIEVRGADGEVLFSAAYGTEGAWPRRADGRGSSLELRPSLAVPGTPAERSAWLGAARNWRASAEFHGSPGAAGEEPEGRVVLNEILSAPLPGGQDAIEILNRSEAFVVASGWWLSDSSENFRKFRLPPNYLVAPGARAVYQESDFNRPGGERNPVPFALSESGDEVYLVEESADGVLRRFVDSVEFGGMSRGITLGRTPDGVGDWALLSAPSLGAPNGPAQGGFESWADTHLPADLALVDRLPGGDPDRDGLANLAEFAFGLPPLRAEGTALWSVPSTGNADPRFAYRQGPGVQGVAFQVERSRDLRAWEPAGAAVEEVSRRVLPDGATEVMLRWTDTGGPAAFVRVGVIPGP